MSWDSLPSVLNAFQGIATAIITVLLLVLVASILYSRRVINVDRADANAWDITRLYYSSEIASGRRVALSLLEDSAWQRVVSRDGYRAFFGLTGEFRSHASVDLEQRRRDEESLRYLLSYYNRLGLLLRSRAINADSVMPLVGPELRPTWEVIESAALYSADPPLTGLVSLHEMYTGWTASNKSRLGRTSVSAQSADAIQEFRVGDFSITFVRDPEQTLGTARRAAWTAECIPAARQAFGNEGVTESDIYLHVMRVSQALFIRDAQGQLVGFSTTVIKADRDPRIIYLEGTAIVPTFQHSGLYSILVPARILFALEALKAQGRKGVLVSTRTQSPLVFRYMSRKVGLYPQPDVAPPASLVPVAAAFAQEVFDKHSDFQSKAGPVFDRATFVMRRAYGYTDADGKEHGVSMYKDMIPWTNDDPAINAFVQTNLEVQNGDAILLIGTSDKTKALSLLEEGVTRLSPDDLSLLRRFQA